MSSRAAFAVLAAGLLIPAAAASLSACSPVTSYSGFQAIESDPKEVKVGTDTKSTVRGRLGSPSATGAFDPNTWFYMNQLKSRVAFKRPEVIARNVTAITFNKDSETVESVNTYTLKDGKVIAFNGRETPTRGRELTILEQILGNVGRGSMLPQDDEGVPGNRPGDRRN
ncbi:outer membrane protein assembly factor BamE [Phenylobacterium sp.]|jgi:outer membrane protein assembly factor BamE (lipoprotein component of BamABCDE complex)|uniref:outer membrane protein assembly factor BamE n=1 Tax=Phenylobacterium sp. TaxID=1871053 RepID=UPI002E2FF534|nr:outer membrane protein assembly factor BamE [Phenylobacterium sp.]HEX4711550.1 outer membrane protein assembly factor BamE [Phenylobacterium sp.]